MEKKVKPKRAYNATLRREQAHATRSRILEAARVLFVARGYGSVTMDEIAQQAGVASQTVYAAFGTKLGVAHGIIYSTFEAEGIHELIAEAQTSADPEVWLRSVAHTTRLVSERLGDLLRFMRESGDSQLLAEYQKVEARRLDQERFLASALQESGRLDAGLSSEEALAVIWAFSGSQLHQQLVTERRWTADRYEQWLGDTLIRVLLTPHQNA